MVKPQISSPPPAPGEKRRLDRVAVTGLRIDDRYQRDLGTKNWSTIYKIAESFDWAKFTPVTVASGPEKDQWILIDGQHRAHAAALAGIESIPAAIVTAPPTRQASIFSGINTQRTSVSALMIYRAALFCDEPWARQAERAVQAGGCTLMTYNKSSNYREPFEIFVVALIRDLIKTGHHAVVTAALRALSGSSCARDVALYRQAVLKPWFAVVASNPDLHERNLTRFVSETYLITNCTSEAGGMSRPGLSKYQAAMVLILEKLARFEWTEQPPSRRRLRKGKTAPRALPPEAHGQWKDDRDALLRESGGKYRVLVDLADRWGMPISAVTARWHRARVAV